LKAKEGGGVPEKKEISMRKEKRLCFGTGGGVDCQNTHELLRPAEKTGNQLGPQGRAESVGNFSGKC